MIKLTEKQKTILEYLYRNRDWQDNVPGSYRTLVSLKRRGLIEFGYRFGQEDYVDRITDLGIKVIKNRIG